MAGPRSSVNSRPRRAWSRRRPAAELPPDGLDISIDVGRIASMVGSIEDRAAAIMEPLRRAVPFQAACISLYDAPRRRYESLVSHGYEPRMHEFFDSPVAATHLELLALNQPGRVLPAREFSRPLPDIRIWAEHLLPAGFRDGVTVGLFTADGRHLGMLAVNTESTAQLSDAACALLHRLAPIIANAIDPMRSIVAAARMVADAHAGVVLTRDGVALPLPGLPGHPLLRTGSPVLAAAVARLAAVGAHASFLCPDPDQGTRDHVRITALVCPVQPFRDLSAVVLVSASDDLAGLTPRELQVLGLIVDGWSNQRIGSGLRVTARTVAAHVEHILVKLPARTRTAAAVQAVRRGSYVPRELAAPAGGVRRAADPARPVRL